MWIQLEQPPQKMVFVPTPLRHMPHGHLPDSCDDGNSDVYNEDGWYKGDVDYHYNNEEDINEVNLYWI